MICINNKKVVISYTETLTKDVLMKIKAQIRTRPYMGRGGSKILLEKEIIVEEITEFMLLNMAGSGLPSYVYKTKEGAEVRFSIHRQQIRDHLEGNIPCITAKIYRGKDDWTVSTLQKEGWKPPKK